MTDVELTKETPKGSEEVDYSLANSDTITKYKDAATIAHKVLSAIEKAAVAGEKLVSLCEKGDKLLEEETAKVYKGKKISKGIAFPTTISPSDIVTPYSPLLSDEKEAGIALKVGQIIKIQLGAQIDGFPAIVGSTIIVPPASGETPAPTPAQADILLATHYCYELLLRLLLPPSVGIAVGGTEEKKEKKPYNQTQINALLKKVCEAFEISLVESTTSYQFERNEVEGKKRVILSPGEGVKGEGMADVGEAWGVEVAVSSGSGKVKTLDSRPTIYRKTGGTTASVKRDTSKKTFHEISKKFGNFPFSLRQLESEITAKTGILECHRANIVRQYEVQGEKDAEKEVARVFSTIIITKNGITQITKPTTSLLELAKGASDKKITDEEVLKILETPINKAKPKKAKK